MHKKIDAIIRQIEAGKPAKIRYLGAGFLAISLIFLGGGGAMLSTSDRAGWSGVIFGGLGVLAYTIDRLFTLPHWTDRSPYRVVVTAESAACEHPQRKREEIGWHDVRCVSVVTTSNGPWQPDMWLLFEGGAAGCSIPTDAQEFEKLWDQISTRFPGFDFKPFMEACGKATEGRSVCWEKRARPSTQPPETGGGTSN